MSFLVKGCHFLSEDVISCQMKLYPVKRNHFLPIEIIPVKRNCFLWREIIPSHWKEFRVNLKRNIFPPVERFEEESGNTDK